MPINRRKFIKTTAVGDMDAWAFDANAGDQIHLSVGELSDITGDFNPWIRVFGPDGATVGEPMGESGSQAVGVSFVADTDGTFTVIIADVETSVLGPDTGDYQLHFFRIPGPYRVRDDGGDMLAGVNYDGTINLGDLDAWSFEAKAADVISLQITELSDLTGDFEPWIRLYGPDGAVVGPLGGASGSTGIEISTVAGADGTYTVIVADIETSILGPDTGTYQLVVEGVTAPPRRPRLSIARLEAGNVQVSWDEPATGWSLMEAEGLNPSNWVASPGAVSIGARRVKEVAPVPDRLLYRLEKMQ